MEALGSPSISRAPMGGAMLSEYRKLVYAGDRYNDKSLSFAYLKSILLLQDFSKDFWPCVRFSLCFFLVLFFASLIIMKSRKKKTKKKKKKKKKKTKQKKQNIKNNNLQNGRTNTLLCRIFFLQIIT